MVAKKSRNLHVTSQRQCQWSEMMITSGRNRELTLKCKLKCYVKPMKESLGVSPSKGNQGTTQGKEKIFWLWWESKARWLQEAEKKTKQTFLAKKEQASRQVQAKTNWRRECCHIHGMTAQKLKGLWVWRANRWQNTGTLDTNYQGQQARWKRHSEEMESWSIPWGSKPKRRHQLVSQTYKRRFQDIESQAWVRWFSAEVASRAEEETQKKLPRPPGKRDHKTEEKKKGKSCGYYGKTAAHPPGWNCPAYGQQCLKCGKYNHYASCCRTGAQPQEGSKETKKERVKKTTEAEETSSDSDVDYIYLQETAQHLHRVKKIRSGPNQDTVLIRIGDIDAFVEPHSGASANVMDEYQFKALKLRSQEIKELEPSRDTLKTLQSNLTVKGELWSKGRWTLPHSYIKAHCWNLECSKLIQKEHLKKPMSWASKLWKHQMTALKQYWANTVTYCEGSIAVGSRIQAGRLKLS